MFATRIMMIVGRSGSAQAYTTTFGSACAMTSRNVNQVYSAAMTAAVEAATAATAVQSMNVSICRLYDCHSTRRNGKLPARQARGRDRSLGRTDQARQRGDRLGHFLRPPPTAESRPAGAGAEPLLPSPADAVPACCTVPARNRTCGL